MEIWRSKDGSRIAAVAASWELNPDKIRFDDLATEFARNEVLAWMNYGSVILRRQGATKALRDADMIGRNASLGRRHPWDPSLEMFPASFRGRTGLTYFAHIDLSKNRDGTGIAIVHRELGTGIWVVDLMLQLTAPPGADIDIAGVRQKFVVDLRDKRGFNIVSVTYDGWQSEESLQHLRKANFLAEVLSVDRTKAPYDTLIGLIAQRKLDYYEYAPFKQQLEELELVKGMKYDHPKKFRDGTPGAKDVSDAVAGAVFNGHLWEAEHFEEPGTIFVHRNPHMTRRDPWGERR